MPIYSPGNEPDRIKDRIKTLFERIDSAYPDKIIVGLHSNHKKMGETVSEIYKALGYESGKDFLEAYGYKLIHTQLLKHCRENILMGVHLIL